jgi:hypothetical protein
MYPFSNTEMADFGGELSSYQKIYVFFQLALVLIQTEHTIINNL